MQFNSGDIFAEHYQLEKKLGTGSFGEVWLARNTLADVEVAIKFYGLLDDNGIKDFREEFKLAYKLHHPNLLHLNHFDVFERCPFLIMPYCSNGSSATLIGKMSEKQIWHFIRDVSCGLMFLHSQNPPIIHQDIKPDNILIGDDGKFIISDFGISRKLEHTFRKSTNKVESSGILAYMGPEHFSEKPFIAGTSDIWSLGMSIYELLTGHILWEGMGGCVQLNGARIPDLDNGYSPQLDQFLHACLSLNTWDRPTAQQAYNYANSMLRQEVNHPHSPSAVHASTPPLPPAPSRLQKRIRLSNINKRMAGWIILSILFLFMLIKGVSAFFGSIEEERRYNACRTTEDFLHFLNHYPASSHAEFVKQKIRILTEDSIKKEIQKNKVIAPISVDTIETEQPKTEEIVAKHPSWSRPKPKVEIVSPAPDTKKVKREEEEHMFLNCQTITDYEKYLRQYPKGKFAYKAKRAIQQIESGMMESHPTQEIHVKKSTRVSFGL